MLFETRMPSESRLGCELVNRSTYYFAFELTRTFHSYLVFHFDYDLMSASLTWTAN